MKGILEGSAFKTHWYAGQLVNIEPISYSLHCFRNYSMSNTNTYLIFFKSMVFCVERDFKIQKLLRIDVL